MDSTSKDIWAQGIKDFLANRESDQSRGRFYWTIYSISYDIVRVIALPFAAIGYAVVDAIKDACGEFNEQTNR